VFSTSARHLFSFTYNNVPLGKHDTIVDLRDSRGGKEVRKVELKGQHTFISDVSRDGKHLVGHAQIPHDIQEKWRDRLQIFDADSGKLIHTLLEQRFGDLKGTVFSLDGKYVASKDHGARAMAVWDVQTGKRVWTFANNQSWNNFPVFARDGKTL